MPTQFRRLLLLAIILAGSGFAIAGAQAQDTTSQGETLFRARCGACHSLETGQNRIAPHLAGIAGRTAGTVEGARYSGALQESGTVWTAETLDPFLANPRRAMPGTTMAVSLPNPAQRAAIIDFLLEQENR